MDKTKVDNSTKTGHINLILTLTITLILPLTLILLSYLEIISGVADFIIAFGVLASVLYIIGGGVYIVLQDKKEGATS